MRQRHLTNCKFRSTTKRMSFSPVLILPAVFYEILPNVLGSFRDYLSLLRTSDDLETLFRITRKSSGGAVISSESFLHGFCCRHSAVQTSPGVAQQDCFANFKVNYITPILPSLPCRPPAKYYIRRTLERIVQECTEPEGVKTFY